MSVHFIENEFLKIGVNNHGAELVSLIGKENSQEYMWSGNPDYWNRVSPVLFPFVGKLKNQTYTHKGITYGPVPQHGYARDSEFSMVEKLEDTIWFELKADDIWKERYPFDFLLRIGYKISGKSVHVMWTVRNDSQEDMPFSIGAHPAFIVPEGNSKNGYFVNFNNDQDKLICGELNENGLLIPQKREFDLKRGMLAICDETFDRDALIIDSDDIHMVSLHMPNGDPFLQVRFDAPQLGIWSPAGKKAPFICIEPWYGRSDRDDFCGELSEREYGNVVHPGHSFNKEYVIDIL